MLVRRSNQARTVDEVNKLVADRKQDLDAVEVEVDRARDRYERHIREVITLLARRFREVCQQAQMEGDIEIVPGIGDSEFGIDVKVAYVPGDPKRSYRSSSHSTGQKAKISILLLLAAMGLEGAADLLIIDEHSAHLDARTATMSGRRCGRCPGRCSSSLPRRPTTRRNDCTGQTTRSGSTRGSPGRRSHRQRC